MGMMVTSELDFTCLTPMKQWRVPSSSGTILPLTKTAPQLILKNYLNKKIWFGIRPEDIHDITDLSLQSNYHEFEVNLEVVEPMGNEAFLYFNMDGTQFIARTPARDVPKSQSNRKLKLNKSKFHFFDIETEKVII